MAIRSTISNNLKDKIFADSWAIRRRWMKVTMIVLWANAELCLGWIFYDRTNSLAAQALFAFLGAILAIIFYYVFGAVWDDNNRMKHFGRFIPSGPEPEDSTDEDTLKTPREE